MTTKINFKKTEGKNFFKKQEAEIHKEKNDRNYKWT